MAAPAVKPQRLDCTIDFSAVSDSRKFAETGTTLVGIGVDGIFPIVSDSGPANMTSALLNRVLSVSEAVDKKLWHQFERFVMDNASLLFPNQYKVGRMPFDQWNSRFPDGKKKRHLVAMEQLNTGQTPKSYYGNQVFIKREHLFKNYRDGECVKPDYTPRVISPFSDWSNIELGPWCANMHVALKENWGSGSLVYGSGLDGLAAGTWANQFDGLECPDVPDLNWLFFENDFTTYDKTQHKGCFRLALKVFKLFGIQSDPMALRAFLAQWRTRGYSKFGHKFTVPATMKSGCPNTTLQNSILNGLMHCFIFATVLGLSCEELLGHMRLIANGDDNVTALPRWLVKDIPQFMERSTEMFKRLGMSPKLCQKPFVQVKMNGGNFTPAMVNGIPTMALTPMLGRLAPKFGYSLDPKNASGEWINGVVEATHRLTALVPFLRHFVQANHFPGLATLPIEKVEMKYRLSKDLKIEFNPSAYLYELRRSGLGPAEEEQYRAELATWEKPFVHSHVIYALHKNDRE